MQEDGTGPASRRIVGAERRTWTQDYLHRYSRGDSMRTIARDTGRSYGFVNRLLTEAGAPKRGRGGPRPRRTR